MHVFVCKWSNILSCFTLGTCSKVSVNQFLSYFLVIELMYNNRDKYFRYCSVVMQFSRVEDF